MLFCAVKHDLDARIRFFNVWKTAQFDRAQNALGGLKTRGFGCFYRRRCHEIQQAELCFDARRFGEGA